MEETRTTKDAVSLDRAAEYLAKHVWHAGFPRTEYARGAYEFVSEFFGISYYELLRLVRNKREETDR